MSKTPEIPGLVKWQIVAGGIAARPKQHSYLWDIEEGSFYLDPANHGSYILRFAWNGLPLPGHNAGGLWTVIARVVRRPQTAPAKAREWLRKAREREREE